VVVRYRIDGVLREVMRLPASAGAALVRRVKVWAKLDVTDPLRPHDGRATARVDGQVVDLRVSTIPVARRGEKVVIRILDKGNLRGTLGDLGLPARELEVLRRLLGHREGMVLVTGPTGSGKTTTLYAALNELKTGKVNIVTVEDPVEYDPVPAETLPADARPPAGREGAVIRRAVGCRSCEGIGYRGRTAILEVMPVDEAVSRLIDAGAMADALIAAGRRAGMYTLWESGLERVWDGTTSLDEVIRVLGERVPDDGTIQGAITPARGGAGAPGPGRVLIADDDPQMRRLIRGVLQRDGFEVVEAGDGLDALEVVEQGGVDLVILDVDMPRLDGLGVLEELRAQVRTACLPVIVLTAQHGETEEKALDLGAHDYLGKPVQTRSLLARVRAVLKRASS
jgi:CheY-like chemotaxis protein